MTHCFNMGAVKHPIISLIRLRTGKTTRAYAKDINVPYWSLVKLLHRAKYRETPAIRRKVAESLGCTVDELFGEGAEEKIKGLIEKEIDKVAVQEALRFKQRLLDKLPENKI